MIYVIKTQAFLRTPRVSMIVEGEDWLVGFDDVFSDMPDETTADFSAINNYPISRLIVHSSSYFQIQLELGAFGEIHPRVCLEHRTITVTGNKTEYAERENNNYLQKGISARGFRRSYEVGGNAKIIDTNQSIGILRIDINQSGELESNSLSKLAQAG